MRRDKGSPWLASLGHGGGGQGRMGVGLHVCAGASFSFLLLCGTFLRTARPLLPVWVLEGEGGLGNPGA